MREHPLSHHLRNAAPITLLTVLTMLLGFSLALEVPAWQHYDEPTHFETARLIADRLSLPVIGDHDPAMRRQIAGSMAEFGFYGKPEDAPNLLVEPKPDIGLSQIDVQPLYYVYLAVPLYFLSSYDVSMQLYLARLFSVMLYVVVVVCAYATASMLFGSNSSMRWLLPIMILLTPAFTDLMSGLNNDVGAAAIGSLLIWLAVRIEQRGFTRLRVVGLIVLIPAAIFTKSTVGPVLLFVALMLALRARIRLRIAVPVVVALIIGTAMLTIDGDGAAEWLSANSAPTRVPTTNAPDGDYAFRIARGDIKNSYVQRIPLPLTHSGASATYTIGAWLWKNGPPEELRLPFVQNVTTGEAFEARAKIGATPTFHTYTVTLTGDWRKAAVLLMAPTGNGDIFFDDITMTPGTAFDADSNLVMNGSAEQPAIRLHPSLGTLESVLRFDPVRSVGVLQSQRLRESYLSRAALVILDSFWVRFGWGQITLDATWRTFLRVVTTMSILLALISLPLQKRRERSFWIAAWLGFIATWVVVSLRGVNVLLEPSNWTPSARYGSPSILFTWLILLSGWRTVARMFSARSIHYAGMAVLLAALFALGAQSLSTMLGYYEKRTTASFADLQNSQAAWRTAAQSIQKEDASAADKALQRYAAMRPNNPFTKIALVDLLTPLCRTAPQGAACTLAIDRWRTLGGTARNALQRGTADHADPVTASASTGWVELAKAFMDPASPTYACDAWLLTITSIPYGAGPEGFVENVLLPNQTVSGAALRWTEATNLCGKSLSTGKDGWAAFYAKSKATLIAHTSTAGVYRLSADMAATFPPANGRILINDREVVQFSVTSDDKQIQQFDWDVLMDAGWHRIEFTFDNDFRSATIDRNLFVASVALSD